MEVCLLITFPGHTAPLPKTEANVNWPRGTEANRREGMWKGRWGGKVQGNRFEIMYVYMTGRLLFPGEGLFSGICVYMCMHVCTYTTYIHIHAATLHTLRYLKWTSTLGRKKQNLDIWDMHTLKWDRNLSYPFKFPCWTQKREYDNLGPWRYQGSLFLLVMWKISWNRLEEQFEDNRDTGYRTEGRQEAE